MNRDHNTARELSLLQQKQSSVGDCFLLEDEMVAFHSICNDIDTQYDRDDTDGLVTLLEDSAVGSGVSQDISSPVLMAVMQSMGESSDNTHEDRDRSTSRDEVMKQTIINESAEYAMAANAIFVAPMGHTGQNVRNRLVDAEKNADTTEDTKNASNNEQQRLPKRAAARKALERSRLAFEDPSNAEILKSTRKRKSKAIKTRDDAMNPRQSKPYDDLIDPNLPADQIRKLRRLLSNRQSARKARLRRQEQIQELETALKESSKVVARLQMELAEAHANRFRVDEENTNLRNEVERLQTSLQMQGAFDEKNHDIPFDSMGML